MNSRKIVAITGTRSDYGLMSPVYAGIAADPALELELIVTGMHLLPEFNSSLQQVESDRFGNLRRVDMLNADDSGKAMAQGLGRAIIGFAEVFAELKPDLALLQGDRGEMLAGAIVAAHMNIPVLHMSGGDRSGTVDEPIRNAISKFAHIHLTTCAASSENLRSMGEDSRRIFEVGEPGLDVIRAMAYLDPEELAAQFRLDPAKPLAIIAQHPVTTEVEAAASQMRETLEAVRDSGMQAICTYPNADAGGREMQQVLESYRGEPLFRIEPNLGSQRFLSLLRIASVIVGNSSSGIFEAPSFRLAAVNIGTRQYGRTRAVNVIDVGHERVAIAAALRHAVFEPAFRASLAHCANPYGDGHAAPRVTDILRRLRITPALVSKWIASSEPLLN